MVVLVACVLFLCFLVSVGGSVVSFVCEGVGFCRLCGFMSSWWVCLYLLEKKKKVAYRGAFGVV